MSSSSRQNPIPGPVRGLLALLLGAALAACATTSPAPGTAHSAGHSHDLALIGQSRYLADAAEGSLAAWDTEHAMLLALNALPGPYGGDRPMVPEAQVMLNRAVQRHADIVELALDYEPLFVVSSPASTLIAVIPDDEAEIEVFDVAKGQRVLALDHEDTIIHAAFSDDGRTLATLGTDGLRLWELPSGDALAHYRAEDEASSQDDPGEVDENASLSSVFATLTLQAVDLPKIIGEGDRSPRLPLVVFSPDGGKIAFPSDQGGLEIRDLSSGRMLHRIDMEPRFLYFSEDGAQILALDSENDRFLSVDVASGAVDTLGEDVIMTQAMRGPDGMMMAGVENGHLIVFDAHGDRFAEIKTASFSENGSGSSTDPRGSLRSSTQVAFGADLVAGATSVGVLVWNLERKYLLEHFRGSRIDAIAASPDGGYLAAGTSEGEVNLWETDLVRSWRTPAETVELPGHEERVVDVGFAGGGEYLVSMGADQVMRIQRLATRKTELDEWWPDLNPAVLSPDGRFLAKYDESRNDLSIWDARSGEELSVIDRSVQALDPNSFDPNSDRILVSSPFTTVLGEEQPAAEMLTVGSGEVKARTMGRKSIVNRSMVIGAGSQWVTAATGDDPAFTVWDSSTGELLRHVDGELLLAGSWLGSRLLTRDGDELVLHDLERNTRAVLTQVLPATTEETLFAQFDHAGDKLLIRQRAEITVWDTDRRKVVESHRSADEPSHVGISDDGQGWFLVVNDELSVREAGSLLDRFDVHPKNLDFAMIDRHILIASPRGSIARIRLPEPVSVPQAIARLPKDRRCLKPEERREFALPALDDGQRQARSCSMAD